MNAPPAGARCGAHPSVAAVDVCLRCGRFLCGECVELVGENAYCAECAARVDAPASALAKAAPVLAGLAWLAFGAAWVAIRVRLFAGVLVLLPGPLALAAMVLGLLEWRRIRRGAAPARGRRWAVAALGVATPLFLLMTALVAYGVFVLR